MRCPAFRPTLLLAALTLLTSLEAARAAPPAGWTDALRAQVQRIDEATPGQLGIYVKRLDNGETLSYQADRPWYLASTAKLPIALAVLQELEARRGSLQQKLVLQETDKVDGSGAVVWQKAGSAFTVESLLKRMLEQSDNTAANMLVRSIGEDTWNRRAQAMMGRGAGTLTSFTQVRRDVYAELHPKARELPNIDLVKIAGAPMGPQRVTALRRTLGVQASELQVPTLEEAYERYYRRGLNSATLEAYGGMLEKFVKGELVSPQHQQVLFIDMKFDRYDNYRLEAGLPRTVKFIHKTGTQFQRACHMGVIHPQDGGRNAIVVATCAEGLDENKLAGQMFEQIGRAITQTMLASGS
ncbi:serine hydrolase [Aquincola tertiaricarbonis]|uniref:serine hydrolase n=1 Tax=Aquincola tertiaricarbonis TaxID=391953 RepID=UPI0012ECFFFA|nr:serine hydrolase [Aquincola tertiaricarbonis]